jgi:hypothetical protein
MKKTHNTLRISLCHTFSEAETIAGKTHALSLSLSLSRSLCYISKVEVSITPTEMVSDGKWRFSEVLICGGFR